MDRSPGSLIEVLGHAPPGKQKHIHADRGGCQPMAVSAGSADAHWESGPAPLPSARGRVADHAHTLNPAALSAIRVEVFSLDGPLGVTGPSVGNRGNSRSWGGPKRGFSQPRNSPPPGRSPKSRRSGILYLSCPQPVEQASGPGRDRRGPQVTSRNRACPAQPGPPFVPTASCAGASASGGTTRRQVTKPSSPRPMPLPAPHLEESFT
jgi:hypothetical protein